jgi:hypothetical protein
MALPPALIQKAVFLRNAAPQQWEEFVAELRNRADETMLNVVRSDAAHIMTAKGAAIEALSLYEDLFNLDRYLRTSAPA